MHRYHRITHTICLLGVLMLCAGTAQAAAFVKFGDIAGESTDRAHRGWSNALTFSQSISRPAATATGTARRRAAAVFDTLTITREMDKASPKLQEAAARGQVLPTVTLHVTAGARVYYTVELKNALISGYSVQGDGAKRPTEEIQVSFAEVKVTYTEYDAKGKARGNVVFQYNVEKAR
jgi:type VI secretion system secreted protein Hcp